MAQAARTRDDASPTPAGPPAGPGARIPGPALVVVVALGLQALGLLWLGVDALRRLGSGALPVGAQVMLGVIYLLVGAWVGATAAGLVRGRGWTRGAATAIELFGVLISTWLLTGGAVTLGTVLLVVSGAALLLLFSAPVNRHLRR